MLSDDIWWAGRRTFLSLPYSWDQGEESELKDGPESVDISGIKSWAGCGLFGQLEGKDKICHAGGF